MIRARHLKIAAIFSLVVGLAVMVSAVYAGRWISIGDGTQALQLDRACKDGFSVIGAFVRGNPNNPNGQYPTAPYNLSFYARLYDKVLEIGVDPDLVEADPTNNPPTPIVAQSFVNIHEQATSINVEDNVNGFDGETTWWGTANIPWTGVLDPAYAYIAMFYSNSPFYAFGFVANPGGLQNCYLFPPDAKDDRFSTRKNTGLPISFSLVMANDTDPNGNPFSIFSYTPPLHGRVIQTSPMTGWYIPNLGFVGTDTATYTIKDSTGATDTATITIDVRP